MKSIFISDYQDYVIVLLSLLAQLVMGFLLVVYPGMQKLILAELIGQSLSRRQLYHEYLLQQFDVAPSDVNITFVADHEPADRASKVR